MPHRATGKPMETQLPKISIITPSFNDKVFLERTILSVLSQQYPNLEYIIIDGGSTDGSIGIIKKYESELAYWISEPDKGMYDALQKGFKKSTGEIMGWINSDDMLHTGSLFSLAQIFNDFPVINWLQGLPNAIDENDRIIFTSPVPEVDKLFFHQKKHIDSKKYIQQESTFWRRPLWEKAGAYISQDYKYAGDFELWIRFFQHEKLHNLNALTGTFRASKNGQASVEHYPEYVEETLKILAAYPLTEEEQKMIKVNRIFKKIERRFLSIKKRYLEKRQLNKNFVVNNTVIFDAALQKFIYIDEKQNPK
jgi:glycosyltransferase involved in cell wall biosynthesis